MEQEQILATLNEKLGKTSLSARTLSEYVGANLPAEGQEFDFDRHVKIIKSLDGNFSADVAKTVEEFKKNYKPQQPKKEDKPIEQKPEEETAMEKVLKRLEELEGRMSEAGKKSHETSLREDVLSKTDSLKVHNKNLWKDCVASISIETEDTQDTVLQKVKESYEKKLKDYFGTGVSPYGGKSAEKSAEESKQAKEAQESFKARMKARGRL